MVSATRMTGEIDWGDYKVRAIVHETALDAEGSCVELLLGFCTSDGSTQWASENVVCDEFKPNREKVLESLLSASMFRTELTDG